MALNDAPDEAKNGGSYAPGSGKTASWFSWMPADLTTLPDTAAVFSELGFEVNDDENGDLLISCYDNKTGQEEVFFAAAAPFIEDGEYEWQGEDGAFWKWSFVGGKMFHSTGERYYTHATPVSVPELHREQAEMVARVEAAFAKKDF
jgi:hypothetical protein